MIAKRGKFNLVARTTTKRLRDAMNISSTLTRYFHEMYRPGVAMVSPKKVIRILQEAGVNFVVMGTHGVGAWRSEPRATQDIDLLVTKKDHAKAVKAVTEAFPKLIVRDTLVVTRFLNPKTEAPVIDLMKPTQAVFKMVFRHTIPVGDTHRVPDLEMALASKFAAMTSPFRDNEKKLIDGGDFTNIVRTNKDDLDLKKLHQLGDKVYPDGGNEILQLVDDILQGKQIRY